MSTQFSAANNLRIPHFQSFQVDTDQSYDARSAVFRAGGTLSSFSFVVTAIAVGTAAVLINPVFPSILSQTPVTISVPVIAGDSTATVASKLANAIRVSPLGYYFNTVVSGTVVTSTAKRIDPLLNVASVALAPANTAGNSYTFSGTSLAAISSELPVGRFLSYSNGSFPTNQNARSIPEVGLAFTLNSLCGFSFYTPDALLLDNNQLVYAAGTPFPMLTKGVVNMRTADNVPLTLAGSVFLSVSGVFQGQIASSVLDVSFQQINLPGQVISVRPIAGQVVSGGIATQKCRIQLLQ